LGISYGEFEEGLSAEYMVAGIKDEWTALENKTKQAKKFIRRGHSIVPLKPAKIFIRTFGKTQVSVRGRVIPASEWKSQSARDLFIFLALHHRSYEKEELGEIFWMNSTPEELKIRFKNTVYRLRRAVGKDMILYEDNRYEINSSIDLETDYEDFQNELVPRHAGESIAETLERLERAIRIHRGLFLKDVDMLWANRMREEIEQKLSALPGSNSRVANSIWQIRRRIEGCTAGN